MRYRIALGVILSLVPFLASSASSAEANNAQDTLAGKWFITADLYGTPVYLRLELDQQGDKVTGTFGGEKIEGTRSGSSVHLLAKNDSGWSASIEGSIANDTLSGSVVETGSGDQDHPERYTFSATRIPERRSYTPQHHDFTPTVFYRQFSASNKPVLTVNPGDTIHTTTVDAGGADEKGNTRVLGGNPETGPFYIQSALPGDTLVIHLNRLRINRDYAMSDDELVERVLGPELAVKMKDAGKTVLWHLDAARNVATLQKPGEHTAAYSVPMRPMLGCIATAPGADRAAPGTGDSGNYGGNMDFNEIVEGATVFLPVSAPGAMLYLGDAHALQGDGELNGNALETSMDVEFTVDILPGQRTPAPRVESTTHIMAMGLAGSLESALKDATGNMSQWLADDYKLTPAEIAEVLGTAAEYRISEVADRNAGVVLKINKDRLKTLAAPKK